MLVDLNQLQRGFVTKLSSKAYKMLNICNGLKIASKNDCHIKLIEIYAWKINDLKSWRWHYG